MNNRTIIYRIVFITAILMLLLIIATCAAAESTGCTATEHKGPIIEINRIPATCTANGSVQKKCSYCGVILATEPIIAQGHQIGEVTTTVYAPTCTAEGQNKTIKKCSVCGAEESTAYTPVPALGHDWGEWTTTKAATCEGTGTERRTCKRGCGAYEDRMIDALGHSWGTSVTTSSTCTMQGTVKQICQRDSNHVNIVSTLPLDPNNHNYGPYVLTSKPTCTTAGVEISTCAYNSEHTMSKTITPLGHDEVVDAAIAATCTETGLTEGRHCARCGVVFVAQETIPKVDHQNVMDAAVTPTCTNTGLTIGFHCKACGEVFVPQREVAALGHDWGEAFYTWADNHLMVTGCCVCSRNSGHTESEQVSASVQIISPTETEEGSAAYTSRAFTNEVFEVQTTTVIIPALSQMKTLRLPADLSGIDVEAFSNLTCEAIIIPDGCIFIGNRAFSGCTKLKYVRIPAGIYYIAEDAFAGCEQVIIDQMIESLCSE